MPLIQNPSSVITSSNQLLNPIPRQVGSFVEQEQEQEQLSPMKNSSHEGLKKAPTETNTFMEGDSHDQMPMSPATQAAHLLNGMASAPFVPSLPLSANNNSKSTKNDEVVQSTSPRDDMHNTSKSYEL